MPQLNRRSATKVRDGRVQRKNRWTPTPGLWQHPAGRVAFIRERPGPGYRHLLTKNELLGFLECVPDWGELSTGLRALVLAETDDCLGWTQDSVVALVAWERTLAWNDAAPRWIDEHEDILRKLEVPVRRRGRHWHIDWEVHTARGFQLVHVLVHELGHHHDGMMSSGVMPRGEPYAEDYARRHEDHLLSVYFDMFVGA